ncbi:MAG: RNA 2',3'-cyclic phosphodiesterase, partial [Planctomycetota bacterium]
VGPNIRWVPAETMHLTLKFLGDVENTEIPAVCEKIDEVCQSIEPFRLGIAGSGAFPNEEKPKVLWLGINEGREELIRLATGIERALADLGFKPEPRDYRPHLTLGRAGRGRVPQAVMEILREARQATVGDFTADSVQLFASYLDKHGPTYNVMATSPLGDF